MLAVDEYVSRLFVWPVAAWGVGLLFLWATGNMEYGISLCYPLAMWWIGVSIWFSRKNKDAIEAGTLRREDADEGVEWIGHTLVFTAGAPAIIFLADNPLHRAAYMTTAGVVITCAICYFAVSFLSKRSMTGAHTTALVIASLAMPINATGALSLGWYLGVFDTVKDVTTEVVPL